jgi:hypothetical protein
MDLMKILHLEAMDRRTMGFQAPELGATQVRLPLGGVASTDRSQVRAPWVPPFSLLAAMALAAVGIFVWLRLILQ